MHYRRTILLSMVVVTLVVTLGSFVLLSIRRWRSNSCEASARSISLSLQGYRDAHGGCLPPPFIDVDETGQRHSWRVMLLPHLTYSSVYGQYSFREAWNGPQNRRFLPDNFYACPSFADSPEITNYVAVVGENTLWPPPKEPAALARYTDGVSELEYTWLTNSGRKVHAEWARKIVVVELVESDIPWMEPRDITVDQFIDTIKANPKGPFYNKYIKGIRGIDASGQLRVINPYDDVDAIRKMFVIPRKKFPD